MNKKPYKLKLFLALFLIGTAFVRSCGEIDFDDLVPTPIPPSPVVVTQDSLVVVREFSQPIESEVIRDLSSTGEVRKWLEQNGVRIRLVDPEQETETGDDWVHEAMQVYKEKGEGQLPWMIYMDTDSRYLIGNVPEIRADFKAALGDYVNAEKK